METAGTLYDILALLGAAVVLVPLLQRLGIPSVLGYLAAGVVLGPYTPGLVVDVEATRPLAEFGVVFLLFAIGLELPLARLRTMQRYIFGLGFLQVALSAALFGGLAYFGWGQGLPAALVIGATLAFSSTATVLVLLVERNEAVSQHGRMAISVLIFQDLAVVPVLALLPLLAGDSHHMAEALGLAAAKALLAIAAIWIIGRFVLRPAYGYLSAIRTPEVFTAANLLLVLAVGWLTAEAGMSMALGAFLAGLLLADSSYRHQVEADIEPFRGLLLGLFFMTVGMSIDLPLVARTWPMILGLTLLLLGLKTAVIALLCRGLGYGWRQGLRVGLLLAQVGEFAFVVFGKAASLHLIKASDSQTLMAAVALSMVLTPLTAAAGRRLSQWRQPIAESPQPAKADIVSAPVLIAGYGRVGQLVARLLRDHHVPTLALDLDSERVAQARENGFPVYYGDASHAGVLRSMGIERARAAVVTVNKPRSAERTVGALRRLAPGLPIIARASDLPQEHLLQGAGASAVVPETLEASLQLAALALRALGLPPAEIERTIQQHRLAHYGMLEQSQSDSKQEPS